MNGSVRQGLLWSLATALVSGVSVYVNKFGVAQVQDAFIYTTLKNSLVAVGLIAIIGLLAGWREVSRFSSRQWASWVALGLIGGGVPFLLFFQGLTEASAPSAALIHKTLFLWVALLGAPILGEKLGGWQLVGLGVLAAGVFLLQPPATLGWGMGENLILIATLLWAVETIVAKKLLAGISSKTAALGRMGFGALVMWVFLAFTGRAGIPLTLTGTQWIWVVITSAFLLAYVWTWYSALKAAPATLVTSMLTLGAVITVLLSGIVEGNPISALQAGAMILMALGIGAFSIRRRYQPAKAVEAE